MRGTPSTWLAISLAGAALLAGCGSSSKSTTASTAATSVPQATATGATSPAGVHTTTHTTTTAAPHTATTTTAPSQAASPSLRGRFKGNLAERTKQAVAFCKQRIRAQPGPVSAKAQLELICEKAGSTNPAVTKEAAREFCVLLVNRSRVTGATRERALARC